MTSAFISIEASSVIFSPVIGIRGNVTIRMEINPIAEIRREEPTIIATVHILVLMIILLERNLYTAELTPNKISGSSV